MAHQTEVAWQQGDYLTLLEEKVDNLISVCQQLARENEILRAQQITVLKERDELLEKNEQSRTRIEAMVARLKSLGQST